MISLVVTRGYGNGTFAGNIPAVSTRGYIAGAPATNTSGLLRFIGLFIGLRF